MLGVTAERFPRGGAFVLGLMGCVGNLAIGVVQPWMGGVNDKITMAAIPAELRNQVVVAGVIEPGKVKALPEADQTSRAGGSEGRGQVVVPLRLGAACDPDLHLRRDRALRSGSRGLQA